MTESPRPPSYLISVKELCEFTAKRGDLDMRFTPSPTAEQGIAGHFKVALRRGGDYEREVPLQLEYKASLCVRGRADGFHAGRKELEEIKTFRGRLERMPENHRALHWAQLKMYGAMLCEDRGLPELKLNLVYFDIKKEKETVLTESCTAADLALFFEQQCARFVSWATQETAHRQSRDRALASLSFPFAAFHPGQRKLAESSYRAARDGNTLMAEAPTGIGKTLGTLFPVLKAADQGRIDRIFYLSAKTPGRKLALDALKQIQPQQEDRPLRILEMVSREKTCEHPDKACHGESCPLAKGFYDRVALARENLVRKSEAPWNQAEVRRVAASQAVCPYYLSQEMARWADIVVGDYNYYFDSTALLHGMTLANGWKSVLLVDEAHNLLERGRAMYSATLNPFVLAEARKTAPRFFKAALDRINREWNRIWRDQEEAYQVYERPPHKFVDALDKFATAVSDYLSDEADGLDPKLQSLYFECLQFRGMAEVFDAHSIFDVSLHQSRYGRAKTRASLCLRNVVPASFLSERFKHAHAAILFSATLQPFDFYRDLLGLPEEVKTLEVPSPFSSKQLAVRVARHVSTRYRDRAASLAPIAALISAQFDKKPGNYLVFFSSFDYLNAAADLLQAERPDIPLMRQSRGMMESERGDFLQRFEPEGQLMGFAVLGGIFAEGIDLAGTRLIGAFIATLGLPQINPMNEEIMRRTEALFPGCGYDYTYLYPGLRKVAQAGGRVIRSAQDEGMLLLMDDRFDSRRIRDLLPSWWPID